MNLIKFYKICEENDSEETLKLLNCILHNKNCYLIDIFQLNSKNNSHVDCEHAIFKSVINCTFSFVYEYILYNLILIIGYKKNPRLFLKLAVQWNNIAIAKTFLSNNIEDTDFDYLFKLSVLLDKVDFVELFLSKGAEISNITKGDLYWLYNYKEKGQNQQSKSLVRYLEGKYFEKKEFVFFKNVLKFLKELLSYDLNDTKEFFPNDSNIQDLKVLIVRLNFLLKTLLKSDKYL
jgi:hypothetical protein